MKKYYTIISIFLLAASCAKQQPPSVAALPRLQNPNDITMQDLVNYFNSKFDCSSSKNPSISKDCFNQNFVPKTVGYIYSQPEYQFADFTGDGAKDALVTISYDGTGAYREFYALTKDPSIKADSVNGIKTAYFNKEAGYPKLENGIYTLTCPYSQANKFIEGSDPSCIVKIRWDKTNNKFIVLSNQQMPDWQTYSNDRLGFGLQYPATWSIDSERSTPTDVVFNNGGVANHISISARPYSKTLSSWLKNFDKNTITKTENMNIDGQPALVVYSSETEGQAGLAAVVYKGQLYLFNEVSILESAGVLSTFKFTK